MENTTPVPFIRTRLSVLMFLQFAIWGAWAPVLGNHMTALKFTGTEIGYVYLTGALACIISPWIAGQVADRWFPTQIYLSLSFFGTAVFLYLVSKETTFQGVFLMALISFLFFGPTLALSNSLAFHHMPDARKDFPIIRLWGTIGWIVAGFILGWWMKTTGAVEVVSLLHGAVYAVICGVYCLTLPNTPPKKDATDKLAMAKVLAMLRDPSFAIFSFLAFMTLIFAAGYYNTTAIFLKDKVGIAGYNVPNVMLIGQVMEILTLLVLPWSIKNLGTKTTIAIGLAAWGLRFLLFSFGEPYQLVVAAQSLHGVCFAFAIAATMIYVEKITAPDVRGSAQSFLVIVSYGFGLGIGSIVCGKIQDYFTVAIGAPENVTRVTDWSKFWLTLAAGCGVVLLLFLVGFKARDTQAATVAGDEPLVDWR